MLTCKNMDLEYLPTTGGYSLQWDKSKEKQFKTGTKNSEIIVPALLVSIALLVGISFGYEVIEIATKRIHRYSDSEAYYYGLFNFLPSRQMVSSLGTHSDIIIYWYTIIIDYGAVFVAIVSSMYSMLVLP